MRTIFRRLAIHRREGVVVRGATVEVFVGANKPSALEARKLGQLSREMVVLWTGSNSDGDSADFRFTSMK